MTDEKPPFLDEAHPEDRKHENLASLVTPPDWNDEWDLPAIVGKITYVVLFFFMMWGLVTFARWLVPGGN